MHEVIGSIPTVSTINKQSRFIGSVLFLVEMVWMRSHVQAASIKEDLHSVATIGSGGQLAAPLAGRGSDSCGARAAVSTKNKTDCASSPFLFLVRIFWMRNNVQVAS